MTTKTKAEARTVTFTAEQFHANPKLAYVQAAKVDRVIVSDSRGEPRMVISRQREAGPRKR